MWKNLEKSSSWVFQKIFIRVWPRLKPGVLLSVYRYWFRTCVQYLSNTLCPGAIGPVNAGFRLAGINICIRHYTRLKFIGASVVQPKTCHHRAGICARNRKRATIGQETVYDSCTEGGMPSGHTQFLRLRNIWHNPVQCVLCENCPVWQSDQEFAHTVPTD